MSVEHELRAAGCPDHLDGQCLAAGISLFDLLALWKALRAQGASLAPALRIVFGILPSPYGPALLAVLDVLYPPGVSP